MWLATWLVERYCLSFEFEAQWDLKAFVMMLLVQRTLQKMLCRCSLNPTPQAPNNPV